MCARFFQRHRDFAFRFFQFRQGAFARAKITAQEQQDRPSSCDRALEVAKNSTVRARRIRMKIHRRMLVSRRAPVFSKTLLVIASAWIQYREAKIFRVGRRHSNCFRLRPPAAPGGFLARKLVELVALSEWRGGFRRVTRMVSPPLLPYPSERAQDSARSLPLSLVARVPLSKPVLLGLAFLPMSPLFRLPAKARVSDRPSRAPNYMGRARPVASALSA